MTFADAARGHEEALESGGTPGIVNGFADGNKRTALYLVELLVRRSGYEFIADDSSIVEIFTGVARSDNDLEELTAWFRQNLVKDPG